MQLHFQCKATRALRITAKRARNSGVLAHPESQNEEENEKSLRKNKKKWSKFGGKKWVELSLTRDCEAGYGPGQEPW